MMHTQLRSSRKTVRRQSSHINVVPLLDIMLVLLVVFMVTAPVMLRGVEVNLPSGTASAISAEKEPLVISIDSKSQIYLLESPIALNVLEDKLQAIVAENPETKVLIKADTKLEYGTVVKLIAAISRTKAKYIGLISKPEK